MTFALLIYGCAPVVDGEPLHIFRELPLLNSITPGTG